MTLHRGYEPAQHCTDGPTPGAKALMAWFLGAFAGQGGKNLGIFNCRTVRGGTTTSLHGEGRACDLGINPHGAPYGTLLAERLRLSSAELGIQCIIWHRRIWSGAYPDSGWRSYSGTNPHVDHLHVELSRAAAGSLTPIRIQQVFAPAPKPRRLFMHLTESEEREILESARFWRGGIAGVRNAGHGYIAVDAIYSTVHNIRDRISERDPGTAEVLAALGSLKASLEGVTGDVTAEVRAAVQAALADVEITLKATSE